jgi:hypothetical protein
MLTVLVVAGLGSVHLATAGLPALAALAAVTGVVGVVPASLRLRTLRTRHPVATWEPVALAVTGCLLAMTVLVSP